jgi:peptidoglycan hydrolase-like protein with peptidoglycan-binding domain
MVMDRWKSVLALTVAGAITAGPAFAQTTAPTAPGDKPSSAARPQPATGTGATKSGDPMKSDAKTRAAGMSREQVKKAQQALKDKGHYDGDIDGLVGPKTRDAMKKFQKAEGIQETGRLDAETMAKLGVQASGASDTSGASASPRTDGGAKSSGGSPPSATAPSATAPSGATPPTGASGGSPAPGAKSGQTR